MPDDHPRAQGLADRQPPRVPERAQRLLAEIRAANPDAINPDDPRARRLVKRLVPHRSRDALRRAATTAALPYARRRACSLAAGVPVRLNLGSGFAPIGGWVNVDLLPAPVDLPWDLRRELPFPAGSVDAVFSEHLYEHLPIAVAHRLSLEAARVLRPGGVLRVAVPDAGLCLRSYARTDDQDWALSRSTRMQAVMSLFYEDGHCTMYDAELLVALLELAGLEQVRSTGFGESVLGDQVPDRASRRDGTLYVEGVKP